MSLNGSQPNFDTYSLMTVIWKIWSELPLTFTPTGWVAKIALLNFELWPNIPLQRKHDINNRKEICQSTGTLLHAPKFGKLDPETAENGWRGFAHPVNFRIGRHCQPYRMAVIQQTADKLWHVLYSGTSLQFRTTECRAGSRWALPCI